MNTTFGNFGLNNSTAVECIIKQALLATAEIISI